MRVIIEGECGVARAEEIKRMLLDALSSGEPIELDLSGVSTLDLSFCQILHAFKLSCREKAVELSVSENLPETQDPVAVICGLPKITGFPARKSRHDAELG